MEETLTIHPTEYRLKPGGGLEGLVPTPAPFQGLQDNEIRIAVKAVSLNARDAAIIAGKYPVPHDRPLVPCSDAAGVVVELGARVTDLAVGDRVVSCFFQNWDTGQAVPFATDVSHGCEIDGMLATTASMRADAVCLIPAGVDFEDAACTPCAGTTAWNALFEFGRLKPGQTVVIQGTGGVAMWAFQLASAAGLRCIVVSSSESKLAQLTQGPGLRTIHSGTTPRWSEEVLRHTDGAGADLIIELGGKGTIGESLTSARLGGKIAIIGGLSGWSYTDFPILEVVTKQIELRGIYVGSREMQLSLLRFVSVNRLRPLIAHTFPFSRASDAFISMKTAERVGKVVVLTSP